MNADQLLAHYDRIADAPDAIARLRRFILDLAVRGKLVPQDPNDEPASELLKRIAKEMVRLEGTGEVRREGALPPISHCNAQRELPPGWALVRLGSIIHLVSGQHLQPPEYSKDPRSGLPYITGPSDFGESGLEITRFALVRKAVAKRGQLLLTVKGSGVGKTANCDLDEVAISRQLMAMRAIDWDRDFLLLVTHLLSETLKERARSLIPGISREDVTRFIVEFPPLAEQYRIVAKVGELMAMCDQIAAARAEREASRDRLAASSLARLNAPDPETFQDDARFVLDALPALTTRPDQIKQLRQTILNLAVRGKLVLQDTGDELMSEGLHWETIAMRSTESCVTSNQQHSTGRSHALGGAFDLPQGWNWFGLGAISIDMRYGTSKKCDYHLDGTPVLRIPNVSSGQISLDDLKFGQLTATEIEDLSLKNGDLLVIRSNGSINIVGRAAEVDVHAEGMAFAGYLIRIRLITEIVLPSFVWLAMKTDHVRDQIEKPIRSTVGLKNVNSKELASLRIPIPPLTEQHRIVAKVDELMALCDQLEASLRDSRDTTARLLEALLAEALAPAKSREFAEFATV